MVNNTHASEGDDNQKITSKSEVLRYTFFNYH
ncbi:MAG: hypothetical protein ACI92W_002215 [Paraglaciecola sp.]|jgi:hypothetical protein